MFGLTALGLFHTAVSLVALASGIAAFAAHGEIRLGTRAGRLYVATTFITAASGLGIFQHGGFGPPHVLSILTLLALGEGMVAATTKLFGGASRYVAAVSFSSTFLFHLIPGFTETLTRLPLGAPVFASPEAPEFRVIYGVLIFGFLAGLAVQLRWLHAQGALKAA